MLGRVFTSETFSKYYTKEVLYYLEFKDLQTLRLVNRFCRDVCQEDDVVRAMVPKNMRKGICTHQPIIRWRSSSPSSALVHESGVCILESLYCGILDKKGTHFTSSLFTQSLLPNCRESLNFFVWADTNVLLINFNEVHIWKHATTTERSVFVFYNVVTGKIERSATLPSGPIAFRIMNFTYDKENDTVRIVYCDSFFCVIMWKLSEKNFSTFTYKKTPIQLYDLFDVHIELVVKLVGTEIQVHNLISGTLVASTIINAPVIKLYIRKNMVAAKIGQTIVSLSRFIVWEICGNELELRCIVRSPSEFSNSEIILGESFGPTLAPLALYLISSKEEKEFGQVSYLQEVDFECRKPKIIFTKDSMSIPFLSNNVTLINFVYKKMDVASTTGLQFYGTTEKNGIVIDIGSMYTKVGFVGESHPRAIIPTDLRAFDGTKIPLSLQKESSHTKKQWKEAIESFLNSIYFHFLQTSPKERRVVVCESFLGMNILKQVLTETLFEKFKVPSVAFLSSESLSIVPLSIATALIVDSGYSETKVLPVYQRIALTSALRSVPLGAHTVHSAVFHLLKDNVTVKKVPESSEPFSLVFNEMPRDMIEDITVKLCYADKFSGHKSVVQPNAWPKAPENKEHAKYKLKNKNPVKKFPGENMGDTVKYNINPTLFIDVPTFIRKEAVDSLFEGDEEENSVVTVVLDSLLKCAPDTRSELAKNILLVGGNTMFKGFSTRLKDELNFLVENDARFVELKGLKGQFEFLYTIFPANYISWLGGSVLGSLEYINTFSTTLENYKKQ